MAQIKFQSGSTLAGRKAPIVKSPGKPVSGAVYTSYRPADRAMLNVNNLQEVQRNTFKKRKHRLIVPTMLSEHWVTLIASWQCLLELFTDPRTGKQRYIWSIDYLSIGSYPIECASGYRLTGTIQQYGPVQARSAGSKSWPKAIYQLNFESTGPTGSKVKSQQKVEFGFLKGQMKTL